MTLGELLAGYASVAPATAGLPLSGLTADSRQVRPGMLFVALPRLDRAGFRFDGHDFLDAAVAAGAAAVVVTRAPALCPVPVVVVEDSRWLLGRLAARWYGDPSQALQLVAMTGTNGKTTSTYLLEACLRRAGHRTAVVGTVETRLDDEHRPAVTTTPDPVTLQALWRECLDRGIDTAVMEVSSHALHQHRVGGTRYVVALFTNLTQDHLDYHHSMEEYFESKAMLFSADDAGQVPQAVINLDDAYGRRLAERVGSGAWTFGRAADAVIRAEAPAFTARGSSFGLVTPAGRWDQHLRILGDYNVQNALGVVGCALALGLPPDAVREALAQCGGAPGRLETVECGQPFAVLVDYAHTPDALEKAIGALRPLTAGRLITVFGCGGDRDRTKRPLMGRIAGAGSDVAVVTADNPRTEQQEQIQADIAAGLNAARAEVIYEPDRRTAIELALRAARAGDVVLIAGKGHEDYQILGAEKIHFDDREVARAWLEGAGR